MLFHYDPVNDPLERAEAVRYAFPGSGARVFSSGSLEFSWALDFSPPGETARRPRCIPASSSSSATSSERERPAPPAWLTTEVVSGRKLRIRIGVRGDPRIARHRVYGARGERPRR